MKGGVSVNELQRLISCDPASGLLRWKERPVSDFPNAGFGKRWNTRYAGSAALNCPDTKGYLRGTIKRRSYFAHRVVWALSHGDWPNGEIDHINGDHTDNRLSNLRVVSSQENKRNRRVTKRTASGVLGVFWDRKRNCWRAQITVSGRAIHLGCFQSMDEAVAARRAADVEYGFHPNHGRAA